MCCISGYSIAWIDVFGYLAPVLHQFVGDFGMVEWVHVTMLAVIIYNSLLPNLLFEGGLVVGEVLLRYTLLLEAQVNDCCVN